ncbi:MAG: alpha/beta fold hydrolase [Gammaproteobacteria bacterium]
MSGNPANPELGRTIEAAGYATNYHDLGSGAPLLMLHGSGPGVSAFANWRLNMPALARDFRVIGVDLLGFGYTAPARDGIYTLARWRDHLLAFLDGLALPRVSVVGNSFGGALALELAVRHPARIDRLVLMGSGGLAMPLTAGLDAAWGYEPSAASMRRLMEIFAYDQSLVSDDLAELRYRASIRPGVYESFARMFAPPREQRIREIAQDEADLAALPHRTLIVHGREDRVVPLESSLRLHQLIVDSQLHVFGRCGHWTQIEHAAAFNRLVRDFLLAD